MAARTDILESCDLLCSHNKNPSLASWSALQFTEKVLKEFISSRVGSFKKIHSIEKLKEEALSAGYKPDPNILWGLFDFDASVRYEPQKVGMRDAIAINNESWRIAYNVLKQY